VIRKDLIVADSDKLQRLDIYLSKKIKTLTRSKIQKLIDEDKVLINGLPRKPSYRLRVGDKIDIRYEENFPENIYPVNLPLKIIYSDDQIILVDKPCGLVVHPIFGRQGEPTLVHGLLYHFPEIEKIGPPGRSGLVHRLDKDTSGVMVIARTKKAYENLQEQFRMRQVKKAYICLVWGKVTKKEGKISWPIGRHIKDRTRMSIKTKKPRHAETFFKVKQRYEEFTLLEIMPVTGRTHQIRVHLSSAGWPVVGDQRYGRIRIKKKFTRLFLHAHNISFLHPSFQVWRTFTSEIPDDFKSFLNQVQ